MREVESIYEIHVAAARRWGRTLLYEVWMACGGRCHLCGRKVHPEDATRDHVIPRSLDGPDSEENIKLAHWACNSARGDLPVEEWFALPLPTRHQLLTKHEKLWQKQKENASPA